jgi:hypothetical protein
MAPRRATRRLSDVYMITGIGNAATLCQRDVNLLPVAS